MDNNQTSPPPPTNQFTPSSTSPATSSPQRTLLDVDITDENVALNVLVSFVNIAQKRGAFEIAESAKIWECVQKFVVTKSQQ